MGKKKGPKKSSGSSSSSGIRNRDNKVNSSVSSKPIEPSKVLEEHKGTWYASWTAVGAGIVVAAAVVYNDRAEMNNDPMSQCTLVMANSTLPNSGWGMFRLTPVLQGHPVSQGDPIIQIPDLTHESGDAIGYLLHNYLWSAEVTGGIHEGQMVYSALPGVGSLANGHPTKWNMVPANGAQVDESGVERSVSAGAGAFTHYHNFSFYAYRSNIGAGEELLVNYGLGWKDKIPDNTEAIRQPVIHLRQNGICLDHIRPGPSDIPHAGRGAFANRFLPKDTIVAPVPLLPIKNHNAFKMANYRKQLALNYCFGHRDSSILFFPYATTVNLINHSGRKPNVKLQWSKASLHYGKPLLNEPLRHVFDRNGLLMELMALRDIEEGEEILLDYGEDWVKAWNRHVRWWVADKSNHKYAHHIHEEVTFVRTEAEQLKTPYPDNIRTTCYFAFRPNVPSPAVWNLENGINEFKNLYPCRVVERSDDNIYTVEILNKETLGNKATIPVGYVVKNVPFQAIRLDDKLRTSDQQLRNVFRHEIGIPDEIFPEIWKDLL